MECDDVAGIVTGGRGRGIDSLGGFYLSFRCFWMRGFLKDEYARRLWFNLEQNYNRG